MDWVGIDMIYFDHAATTPVRVEAFEAMTPWISDMVGNPNSLHKAGGMARRVVNCARESVADLIGADHPNDIVFTSGGTESDNFAILGMIPYLISKQKCIVVSSIEHHAILNQVSRAEEIGVPVIKAPVLQSGVVDLAWLETILKESNVGLVSIMTANNETGVKQPIKQISKLCHQNGAFFHSDAVQAVGHMCVDVDELGVDMLSLSGHKFGACGGVGALYLTKYIRDVISPIILGGGQEYGLRSGTENVAGIASIGAAAANVLQNIGKEISLYHELSSKFVNHLMVYGCEFDVNFRGQDRVENILSLRFPGVVAELLVRMCDNSGLCISAASACSSGSSSPSHVLKACGLSDDAAQSTVRISFGHTSTLDDAALGSAILFSNVRKIRDMIRK